MAQLAPSSSDGGLFGLDFRQIFPTIFLLVSYPHLAHQVLVIAERCRFFYSLRVLHKVLPISVEYLRPVMRDVALFDKLMLIRAITAEVE